MGISFKALKKATSDLTSRKVEFISEEEIKERRPGSRGFCSREGIVINRDKPKGVQARCLLHEVGHALLGHNFSALPHGAKEWEAETFCEEVCRLIGLKAPTLAYRQRYPSEGYNETKARLEASAFVKYYLKIK